METPGTLFCIIEIRNGDAWYFFLFQYIIYGGDAWYPKSFLKIMMEKPRLEMKITMETPGTRFKKKVIINKHFPIKSQIKQYSHLKDNFIVANLNNFLNTLLQIDHPWIRKAPKYSFSRFQRKIKVYYLDSLTLCEIY
jgi:hypothetical protein